MSNNWFRLRKKVGGKWKFPILETLDALPRRFNKIKSLTGISSNMLSTKSAEMVEHGLITKKKDLYTITDIGKKAVKLIKQMFDIL